jgi:ribosomal protein L37AE/L43A
VAGAALVLGDIAWMYAISRRMTEHVYCPDCHKRHIALPDVQSFVCEDCGQEIALQKASAAVPPPDRATA